MVSARLSRIGRVEVSPLVQGSIDHQLEALLRGRELRDVVTRVGSSDMLLHGAIAFLLHDDVPGQMLTIPFFLFLLSFFFTHCPACTPGARRSSSPRCTQAQIWRRETALTPKHRFRQLEPSLLVNGQTTSLLASETEKELVREARGGMVCMYLSLPSAERWGGGGGGMDNWAGS